jgi:replication-associated recombination protein RarA
MIEPEEPYEFPTDIMEALAEIIKPEALDEWLDQPNLVFYMKVPREMIEAGEDQWIWDLIWQVRTGCFS